MVAIGKSGPEEMVSVSAGSGRLAVRGSAVMTGAGVVVHLFGGDRPHVGSVVVSVPRPSLQAGGGTSCTSSVINLTGHKEEDIARPVAEQLARALNQPVVVVAGVHVDNANLVDIEQIGENARALSAELLAVLGNGPERSR